MPEININVRDKCAEGEGVVICNNSDYTVVWDLDEEWTPYDAKTMRVNLADGTYQDVVFSGDTAALPVLSTPGWASVGLYAGDLHTSRAADLRVLPSVTTPGGAPADPAEDVYDQLTEKLNRLIAVQPESVAQAVADYLTEHPAVSSMRVEGGYIQFSGDGETWENVIALADLKGPKGDTGAGMDITGATVGQIARISAVDDNGVPTEWEPADMASAGSETMNLSWKHIRDVELTPDAIEAIVSTTDAGNTFSYDEIMLELIPNLAGYFYVRASQSVNLSANVAMWVTNSKYTQMHLGLLGKKLAITSAFRTDGSLGFSNNYGGNGDIDKISTIVFGASAPVGAAFTVKIWGR